MAPFPPGHFYSPVISAEDLRARRNELWSDEPHELVGLDLDLAGQRRLLNKVQSFAQDFDYATGPPLPEAEVAGFRDGNGLFEGLDARMLFCMLRLLRPQRLVEVGSGHSTLLTSDLNRRHLSGQIDITCIEPYPPEYLRGGVEGVARLIEQPVQAVGLDPFLALEAGDVLFIDSSHVSKTGSDVNFLYFEVLPRLAKGVVIHVHDIFLPVEYPEDWVLGEERSWNEQYILRAMLMFSRGFRVLFGCHSATCFFPELVQDVFGERYGGGSFWIEKTI